MLETIQTLCRIPGISGWEDAVREQIRRQAQQYADEILEDANGNLLVFKRGRSRPTKTVMLAAHMDEVGLVVKSATDDGFLKFGFAGGIDRRVVDVYKRQTQYMPVCAISSGGAYLAAVALGQNNGAFESTATIFKTDETEVYSTLSLGNQLILDLKYLTQRELCAIGESNIQFFSVDGQLTGAYDLKDQYLKGYDMGANGFILLCVNQYRAGNRYSVVTIDTNGNEIANRYIGKEILDISACGNYVAVLTSEEVTIYNKSLEVYQAKENTDAASKVLMRSDGSAILIGGGKAKLYLP